MVTVSLLATALVVSTNEAPEVPRVTTTLAGTEALTGSLEVKVTVVPLFGAGLFKYTEPPTLWAPVTELKLNFTEVKTGGTSRTVVALLNPLKLALTVTVSFADTGWKVRTKFPVLGPAMLKVAGTDAVTVSLDFNVTVIPLLGVGPFRFTWPATLLELVGSGLIAIEVICGAAKVSVASLTTEPDVALMVTFSSDATGSPLITNDANEEPVATVTETGTEAFVGSLDLRATVVAVFTGPLKLTEPIKVSFVCDSGLINKEYKDAVASTVRVDSA
jgi:hypothetical protein